MRMFLAGFIVTILTISNISLAQAGTWELIYPDDRVAFTNEFDTLATVNVYVKKYLHKGNRQVLSDRIVMICDKITVKIVPDTSSVCHLDGGTSMRLLIDSKDYHNGAKGSALISRVD